MRNKVFICYSHKDNEFLKRLTIHLKPLEKNGLIDVWSDQKINIGDDWRRTIETSLSEAKIAILLITADFLASDFIIDNELPRLLDKTEKEGLKIISVILKPCSFLSNKAVSKYQAINNPEYPLIKMKEANREEIWNKIYAEVEKLFPDSLKPSTSNDVSVFNEDDYVNTKLCSVRISDIKSYYSYQYQHHDYMEGMELLSDYMKKEKESDHKKLKEALKEKFYEAGWEGDGEIRVYWMSPFLGQGIEDAWGFNIFTVRQSNNGTTWIISPLELNFQPLLEQNNYN